MDVSRGRWSRRCQATATESPQVSSHHLGPAATGSLAKESIHAINPVLGQIGQPPFAISCCTSPGQRLDLVTVTPRVLIGLSSRCGCCVMALRTSDDRRHTVERYG